MPVNLTAIRDLLLPGLRGIQGQYRGWPTMTEEEPKERDQILPSGNFTLEEITEYENA